MKKSRFIPLVGFECRKTFLTPWMLLFMAVLLAANGLKIWSAYREVTLPFAPYRQVYGDFYSRYSGAVTPEKVSHLMTIYGPLEEKAKNMTLSGEYDPEAYTYSEATDEDFFRRLFYTQMKYTYLYGNNAYAISQRATELSDLYRQAGSLFEARKNEIIARDFSGRSVPEFHEFQGWELLLNYDYSVMLVLILCLFPLCGIFVREQSTQMYMLLRTTKKGGGQTVAAKLTAAILLAGGLCLLFFGLDVLLVLASSGCSRLLSCPVHALPYMQFTPLNITLGQYFLLAALWKFLGVLGFVCIFLLLSSLCRQTLTAFLSGLACLIGGVLLTEFSRGRFHLQWWNPAQLLFPRAMTSREEFVNVLGLPVRQWILVTVGVVLVMGIALLWLLYRNRSFHNRMRRRACHASV